MVEQPTIQSADTDGNGPAKRRRRPALSCVECRMRKAPEIPNQFNAIVNRYVAPGLLGECDGQPKPLPSNRPAFGLNSHSDSAQASIINSLLDRIQGLEERLASATLNENPRSSTSPRRESASDTSAQFVKAKYYGQSHWMNAIDPVSA
ncbi:uncharacterized protein J4E78_002865 [Alternaria triticimaculans]|uniref:uncharacterized protein n=1 Tax=Alternaria triticimaculans TaxID=297637 RepID=UPI0020C3A633|nr:uncharacterized protein J4E78_002865 [Alternaria triticimaculans]KAI4665404.1 hypothetical protein J4E78_002865 [Alternaria triticimaculans]